MKSYTEQHKVLSQQFRLGEDKKINEYGANIRFIQFTSSAQSIESPELLHFSDNTITENNQFQYPVFFPSDQKVYDRTILLLHGLNERSWDKYLTWAERLACDMNVPVILFPIAFHMNRAPLVWANPRAMLKSLELRKKTWGDERSMSFANLALSDRLSEHPDRFYLSGRQTLFDIIRLAEEIKKGEHPYLKSGSDIDIFAYSIGAFLAQIALMDNHKNLFSDSRLFMFCGGSIFSAMSGISRSILDKPAFKRLKQYYTNFFGKEENKRWKDDNAFTSFRKMLAPDLFKIERERFFTDIKERIAGISLSADRVIPYHGVELALGRTNAQQRIELHDFSFNYSHEVPFPLKERDTSAVNNAFDQVFSTASLFFNKG